jgi:hypothetical protein
VIILTRTRDRKCTTTRGITILVLLVVLSMSLPNVLASTGNETVVRVVPERGSYQVGQGTTIEVWIEDVADLYCADVRLTFDASRFAVLEVTPRSDLLSPDLVIKQEIDNEAGTVWYVATQLNPREPASGSGALFSFTLRMLSAGQGSIEVQYTELSTRYGEEIPASTANALYTVGAGALHTIFLPLVSTAH